MKKPLGYLFLIFFVLVIFNYLFAAAGRFFSSSAHADQAFFGLAADPLPSPNQLAAIDLDLFGIKGVDRNYITQGYGRTSFSYVYKGNWHNGIDIAAAYGAPIFSPGEGIVIATGNQDNYCPQRGFGRFVAVDDGGNNLVLWYGHLGIIDVKPGQTVKKGTEIGRVGSTGFETGTHLHFSIFDEKGFSMTPRNGCGPDATGDDLNPLSYLGTTYQ